MTDPWLARKLGELIGELLDEADKHGGDDCVSVALSLSVLDPYEEFPQVWTHRWELHVPYGELGQVTRTQHRGFKPPAKPNA